MRAKLQVSNVVPAAEGSNFEQLAFTAVSEKPFDAEGKSEDNDFARWTPTAKLEMTVTNPELFGKFIVGEKYYVDFTKAE